MSSWRSSNVDEMVRVAFTEKGTSPSKEERYWRVPSVVGPAILHCGFPTAGGAPCSGAAVGVAVDDDGVVLGCPGKGAPQSLEWCSSLQMVAPSKVLRSGRASPMGA